MRFPRARTVVLVGTGALVAGVLAAAPAQAQGPATTVTILLKAPHPAALARLASATGLTHAQRMTALDAVLPDAAEHRKIVDALTARGFTIGHETAWTIDATAPQQSVTSTFGTTSRLRRAVLSSVPAAIAGVTAAVLPATSSTGLFTPQDDCPGGCHDGADFRNAYTAPDVSPATGKDKNATLTIATFQFANWNDSDLTAYAENTDAPLGDPVASGQYQQFGVKGSALTGATTAEKGLDEEVDLDQESILSTDPYADQRTYVDTNSARGYIQALTQVLADVTQGEGAIGGGDPHIVALSTSWGACESGFGFSFPGDTTAAIETLLQSLTAAGVTIFAASGDDGIYDCGISKTSTTVAVDYPASSPEVVGVGGTRLKSIGGDAANDGSNWSDTGWSCATTEACEAASGTGGSGGGESQDFALPSYQSAGIGSQKFTTSTGEKGNFGTQPHRLVPDIAADGDPATGFEIVTSDPTDVCNGSLLPSPLCNPPGKTTTLGVGGTSLAAPVSAALFTDMLAAHGVTSGVGDIHGALYSAYAHHDGAFRDVTTGRNGNQRDVDAKAAKKKAAELPVNARTGYDTVTGLGTPLWPKIAPYLFHPKLPDAVVKAKLASPHSRRHPTRIRVSWRPHTGSGSVLLAGSAEVGIKRMGRAKAVYSRHHAAATGSYVFTGKPGAEYVVSVGERALGGTVTPAKTRSVVVPYDDSHLALHGSWRTVASPQDFGGTNIATASTPASATITATGRTYAAAVRTGPSYGRLAVFHAHKKVATIDLYSARHGRAVVPFFGSTNTRLNKRTFTFRYTGAHDPAASGTTVDLDAIDVSR